MYVPVIRYLCWTIFSSWDLLGTETLNRIKFVVTMACTGKCKHCSEGEHTNYTGHIETDVAVIAIREVCENYKMESLMAFGGEPYFIRK